MIHQATESCPFLLPGRINELLFPSLVKLVVGIQLVGMVIHPQLELVIIRVHLIRMVVQISLGLIRFHT